MNSQHTKEIRIINSIIFFVAILAAILPNILLHQDTRTVHVMPDEFSSGNNTLEHRLRTKGEPPVDVFFTDISRETLSDLPKTDLGLVIARMDGQGYKLWWNGNFIGQAGDPYTGKANIWNSTNVFLVQGSLIEENNTLTIQTYALYEVGIFEDTVQIASWREALRIKSRHDILSNGITLISIGMSIFAVITILVHTILHAYNRRKMLAIAAAMLLISIYGIDYLQINYFSVSYLVYKKMVTASLYLSVLFVSAAVGSSVKSKVPITLSSILFGVYVLAELLIRDIITFKAFYNYYTLLLPINLAIWLVVLARKINDRIEARIFFGMLCIGVVVGIWQVTSLIVMPNGLAASPFPLVIIAGAVLTMLLALSSIERNRQLEAEIAQKDALFVRAISDAQTGIYNKPYFSSLLDEATPPFTVAMVDIDNFKKLNDNYGHMIGDAGILMVADTIKANFGEDGILGRYGGDEFMTALHCAPDKAEAICEKIRKTIESTTVRWKKQEVNLTVSIGVYHVKKKKTADQALQKADMALYAAKSAGKNCIKTYKKKQKKN
ncbi:MAG: GGDEF domain-containing protein [Eubacteriales bacterium]